MLYALLLLIVIAIVAPDFVAELLGLAVKAAVWVCLFGFIWAIAVMVTA